MNLLTTEQAAAKLGLSRVRIQQMIRAGTLKAERIGGHYFINPKDMPAEAPWKTNKPGRRASRDLP